MLLALLWASLLSIIPQQARAEAIGYSLDKSVCESKSCIFDLRPEQDLHFNLEAPNALGSGSVITKQKELIRVENASTQDLAVTLFVCDANETYCAKREALIHHEGEGLYDLEARGAGAAAKTLPAIDAPEAPFKEAIEEAIKRAKHSDRLVLADFSAVWCPACLRLEEEVLDRPDFRPLAKKFIQVRVDSDQPGTDAWKKRYSITDMPTLLVLDGDGNEISRFHGFRVKTQLARELEAVLAQRPLALTALKEKADAGDRDARDQVGLQAFSAIQMSEAAKYLEGSKKERERWLQAQVELSEKDLDLKTRWLETLLEEFSKSIDAPRWSLERAQNLKDQSAKTAAAQKALALARNLHARPQPLRSQFSIDPTRDEVEIGSYEMLAIEAESLALLNQPTESAKAWAEAIKELKAAPQSSGQGLILVRYLDHSGREKEIEATLKSLSAKYPKLYIFNRLLAKRYLKEQNWAKAEVQARLAYKKTFAANHIDAAVLLDQILRAQAKPMKEKQAREICRETLKDVRPNEYSRDYLVKEIKALEDGAKEATD